MRILVICDDYYHPSLVPRTGLGKLKGSEFIFDWIENHRELSPERLASYPMAILTKGNKLTEAEESTWMTEAVETTFSDYVRKGNGLVAIHSGTAGYQQTPVLRSLLGGVFSHHPEQGPVTVVPQAGHPLSAGSEAFTMKDEHYVMIMDDPQADVFLTTQSEHGEQPGAWTRTEGKGRVGVLTPGHNVEVWLHPSFQTLLRNTLNWCGKIT